MVFAEVGKTGARNENHIDEKWGSNILLNQHICQACESNSWYNGGRQVLWSLCQTLLFAQQYSILKIIMGIRDNTSEGNPVKGQKHQLREGSNVQ